MFEQISFNLVDRFQKNNTKVIEEKPKVLVALQNKVNSTYSGFFHDELLWN